MSSVVRLAVRRPLLVAVALALLAVSGGQAAAVATGLVNVPLRLAWGESAPQFGVPPPVGDAAPVVTSALDGVSVYGEGADAGAERCPIVALGDSYTVGWAAEDLRDNYPSRMERALGHPVVNAGVSGETAEEGLRRLEADVLAYDPCLVIVEFGTNEAFRGYDVGVALDGMEDIVKRLHAAGIPVVIVGTHMADYEFDYDAGLIDIARRYEAHLVLGVLDGILSDPALRGDKFHPNGEGYGRMWERMEPVVRAALPAVRTA